MSYTSFRNDQPGDAQPGLLRFQRTNNFGSVGANNLLGEILWEGFDATVPPGQFKSASYIQCKAVGAPAGNVPSELQFNTSFGTGTQLAMNIGQYGDVTINTQLGTALNINGVASGIAAQINNVGTSLDFSSTAQRITADMSNATHANRLAFQSNVTNGATSPFILPNGTSQTASIVASNNSDPTNSAFAQLQVDSLSAKIVSGVLGTGTLLPFELRIGSANTAVSISTNRNVTINAPASGTALTVTGATGSFAADFTGTNAGGISVSQSTGGASSYQAVQSSVDVQPVYFNAFKNRAGGDINAGDILLQHNIFGYRGTNQIAGAMRCYAESVGATRASGAFDWFTTSTAGVLGQRLYLSADGAVVINSPAAANTALYVNGYNVTGTYGAQFSADVPGALFDGIRAINVTNTAGSSCQIECAVSSQALTTGGDPYLRFVNYGLNAVSIGWDTSTQQYAMTSGSGIGGIGNFFTWSVANNQINLPLQASFHAYIGTSQLNVTGDGTNYDVIFDVERYDVSSSYDAATGVFTAPVTGKYMFTSQLIIEGLTAGMTTGVYGFWINGGSYVGGVTYCNPYACALGSSFFSIQNTALMSLSAGDTVQCRVQVNGGAKVCDFTNQTASFFAGQLLS